MYPLGASATIFDKKCRQIARKLNNKVVHNKANFPEELNLLFEKMDKSDLQHTLQYVRFNLLYTYAPLQKLITSEVLASSYQRESARLFRDKENITNITNIYLPLIPLFKSDRSRSWCNRELEPFETKHYHIPPRHEFVEDLKKIKDMKSFLIFCEKYTINLKPYTDPGKIDSNWSKLDFETFAFQEDGSITTSYGGIRFLATGFLFVTPDIWYDKEIMKKIMKKGFGILMYEPCKHFPRCDTYDGEYYENVFHFLI